MEIDSTSSFTESALLLGTNSAEDVSVKMDGLTQDFYAGLDHSASSYVIGSGLVVGTNPLLSIANNGNVTITGGLTVGNSTSTVAGTIRYSGGQFEGYNGSSWGSLGGGADTFLGLTDTPSSYTAGSVLFTSGSAVTQDNANFFFDDNNNRLGLGTTTPGAMLNLFGVNNKLRLSYDAANYTDIYVNSNGELEFNSTNVVNESSLLLGAGIAEDISVKFDGLVQDFYAGLDNDTNSFMIGSGLAIGSSPLFTINSSGNIGIGDSTPASLFTVGTADAFRINSSGQITSGTWMGSAIGVAYGGTGLTAYGAANQIMGMNAAGNALEYKTVNGTTNQVNVANAANSITLSLPQSINTAATPTFGGMTLSNLTSGSIVFAGAGGLISQDNANFFWNNTTDRLGIGTNNPSAMLDLYGVNNKLRFSYDGSNYAALYANSTGGLRVESSSSVESAVLIGTGSAQDVSVQMDGFAQDYYAGLDDTTGSYMIGSGFVVGTNPYLTVSSAGNVGIGDSTPASLFTVGTADAFQINASGQVTSGTWMGSAIGAQYGGTGINTSASTGIPTISAGTWSVSSSLGVAMGGTGTTTQFTPGSIVFAGASGVYTQDNSNFFWDDTNNRLGLGNTVPSYTLDVNSALGSSNIFRLAYDNNDILTVTDSQTTIYNPVNFASAGDVSMAYDLIMANSTSANITFEGSGYIKTESAWQNLNLNLSAANDGQVIVADTLLNDLDLSTTTAGSYYGSNIDLDSTGVFTTGATNIYGLNSNATASGISTGGTVNVYGGYFQATGENTGAATTTAYGLYVNGATGADTNYSAVFMNGRVGIGDSTPDHTLDIAGNLGLNTGSYINFGDTDGSSGYGFRDNAGVMEFRSSAGSWTALGASGSSTFLGLTDTPSSYTAGSILFTSGAAVTQDNANFFWDDSNNRLGIGTNNPSAMLDLYGVNNKLRFSYDGSNYTAMYANSSGELVLESSAVATDAAMVIGTGVAQDVSVQMDGFAQDYYAGLDDTTGSYMIGSGFVVGTNPRLTITSTGSVGIGDSTPDHTLDIAGNLGLNAGSYINFGDVDGSSGYGFRDNAGVMEFKNSGGSWTTFGSGGGSSTFLGLTDTPSSYTAGSILFTSGAAVTQDNANFFWDDSNNRLGIGTNSPNGMLNLFGTNNSLRFSYDVSNYVTLSSDSTGALVMDGTGTSGSKITIGSGAAEDSLAILDGNAQDFHLGLDDTDDLFKIGLGGALGTNDFFSMDSNGRIGINTVAQTAQMHINGVAGRVSMEINSNETTGTNNIFMLRSDVASADDAVFRIQANGALFADTTATWTGADYAEYFYTKDTDLLPGETVCVDEENSNSVKRCDRSGDVNVMGIVSSNPAVVGNYEDGRDNNENYKVIAMIGQIPAKVNDESGAVNIGDSLTSSSTPGYLRKAEAGESTVGIALERLGSGDGDIQVMISRRNKSLTVETVEQSIQERIAQMEIEDQVNQIIANGTEILDIRTRLSALEMANMGNGLLMTDIQNQMTQIKDQIKDVDFAEMNDKLDALLSFLDATDGDIYINGKLEAEITETGALVIKNAPDKDAPTIGASKICGLIPVDKDDNKVDDCSGNKIPFDGDNDKMDDASGNMEPMPKDENHDWINDETNKGIVNAGNIMFVKSKAVNPNSKIFVTPKKSMIAQPLIVTKFDIGNGFNVEIKDAINEMVEFDWWIVEEGKDE